MVHSFIAPVTLHLVWPLVLTFANPLPLHVHTETQFGVLPTLEFDGKRLSGNGPIARYLAEKYGEKYKSISLHNAFLQLLSAIMLSRWIGVF